MRNFGRLLCGTAAGAIAGAFIWVGTANATVYAIEGQDIPPATVTGTITTDGTLGVLTAANIISVDLTVSDGSGTGAPDIVIGFAGTSLTATSAGLFFDYDGVDPDFFAVIDNTSAPISSGYCVTTGLTPCVGGGPQNSETIVVQGTDYFGPTESGEVQIAIAVVPEASTWAMLLIGFAGLGGYARHWTPRRTGLGAAA